MNSIRRYYGCLSTVWSLLPLGEWDQCLHSAEADVRPPRRKSGFDPWRCVRTEPRSPGPVAKCLAHPLTDFCKFDILPYTAPAHGGSKCNSIKAATQKSSTSFSLRSCME